MSATTLNTEYFELTERVRAALRAQEGIKGKSLAAALHKGRYRLPKHVRKQGALILAAEARAGHPKLAQTLDMDALRKAEKAISAYLETIDRADRRKGWWLGMLGGLAFNMLVFLALFFTVLYWRDLL